MSDNYQVLLGDIKKRKILASAPVTDGLGFSEGFNEPGSASFSMPLDTSSTIEVSLPNNDRLVDHIQSKPELLAHWRLHEDTEASTFQSVSGTFPGVYVETPQSVTGPASSTAPKAKELHNGFQSFTYNYQDTFAGSSLNDMWQNTGAPVTVSGGSVLTGTQSVLTLDPGQYHPFDETHSYIRLYVGDVGESITLTVTSDNGKSFTFKVTEFNDGGNRFETNSTDDGVNALRWDSSKELEYIDIHLDLGYVFARSYYTDTTSTRFFVSDTPADFANVKISILLNSGNTGSNTSSLTEFDWEDASRTFTTSDSSYGYVPDTEFLPIASKLSGNNPFSFSFFFRLEDNADPFQRIISWDNGSSGIYFLVDSDDFLRFHRSVGGSFYSIRITNHAPVAGEWYHSLATYDGSTMELTLSRLSNGDSWSITGTNTDSMPVLDLPLAFGCKANDLGSYIIDVSLCDVAIFDDVIDIDLTSLETELVTNSLEIPGLQSQDFEPGRTCVFIMRNQAVVWSGVVWTRQFDLVNQSVSVGCEGWLSLLNRRLLKTDQTFSSTEQTDIAKALITLGDPDGLFNLDDADATGVTRDRTYLGEDWSSIGELVVNLAEVENGFRFYFDTPFNANFPEIRFLVAYPYAGRDTNHIFELGSNISALSLSEDGKQLTNQAYAIGKANDLSGVAPEAEADSPGSLVSYPLLESAVSYSDITTQSVLQAKADLMVSVNDTPLRTMNLGVYADTLPDPFAYNVGDCVTVLAEYGVLSVSGKWLITQKSVSVAPTGSEDVTLQLVEDIS